MSSGEIPHHEPIIDLSELDGPVQRTVFTDVAGDVAIGGDLLPQTYPDFDATQYTQGRSGSIVPYQEFDITAWPNVSTHGFTVAHDIRANVLPNQVAQLEAFRDRRGIEQETPFEREIKLAQRGLFVVLGNHNPRDTQHNHSGENGRRWHVGTTSAEGTVFIGQAHRFDSLARFGLLDTFGAVPPEVTDEFYDADGEQFTSSYAMLFSVLGKDDIEQIHDAEAYLGLTPLEHAVLEYADKFGNVQLLANNHAELVASISAGAEFKLVVNGRTLNKTVKATENLKAAEHDGSWVLYTRPGATTPTGDVGYVQLVAPLDDIRDWEKSAAYGLISHIEETQDARFDPHQLDRVSIEIEPV